MTKYIKKELAKYWPVSPELMAQYNDGSHTRKDSSGNLEWKKDGKTHRDGDKPAYIGADGSLLWTQNGKIHRDGDKPAWICSDGTLYWCQNGQWHRSCGPAVIRSDGRQEWWINGKDITQEVNEWLAGEEWQGTPEQIVEFKLRFV